MPRIVCVRPSTEKKVANEPERVAVNESEITDISYYVDDSGDGFIIFLKGERKVTVPGDWATSWLREQMGV